MYERVVEVDGLFVVAFASPAGLSSDYLPQFKVFPAKPAGYFDAGYLVRGTRATRHADAQAALDAAEERGRQEVARIRARVG